MIEILGQVLAYVGAIGVAWKSWQYLMAYRSDITAQSACAQNDLLPLVSIILPVRNEAQVLPNLLESLLQLKYPYLEIIVVDDHSDDQTSEIVKKYPITLVKAPSKPKDWVGKNWACYVGAAIAKGSFLLFTDADTIHAPNSLNRAIEFLKVNRADLVSATSYYLNRNWWEKLLGPFYCLVYLGASPYESYSSNKAYAIGQYMLFDTHFYHRIGGHASVSGSLAEDAALAQLTLANEGGFKMYKGSPLYGVQMYKQFREFVQGWIRLLRLGMKQLSFSVMISSLLPLFALNILNIHRLEIFFWVPILCTLFCMYVMQQKMGRFSLLGVILFPIPILLFMILAIWATICELLKIPFIWRGRSYQQVGELIIQ